MRLESEDYVGTGSCQPFQVRAEWMSFHRLGLVQVVMESEISSKKAGLSPFHTYKTIILPCIGL